MLTRKIYGRPTSTVQRNISGQTTGTQTSTNNYLEYFVEDFSITNQIPAVVIKVKICNFRYLLKSKIYFLINLESD